MLDLHRKYTVRLAIEDRLIHGQNDPMTFSRLAEQLRSSTETAILYKQQQVAVSFN